MDPQQSPPLTQEVQPAAPGVDVLRAAPRALRPAFAVRLRTAGARILDNAMLYKDMTQWIRNKTFLLLFFGLLIAAEIVSMFIMGLGEEVDQPGSAVFSTLYMVLMIYGVVIAFMGHGLTSREFQNKTFELYELSGMSLERMIGGKFLSMAYQFCFGFFCLVPFMFFAYFLGGLDFLDILSGIVLAGMLVAPAYLLALLTALTSKLKQIATLGRVLAVGLLVMMSFAGIVSIFSRNWFGSELFNATTAVLKMIFSGDGDAIAGTAVFLLFYLQLCLLLFYLCCHMISRETDSREIPIKVLSLTLIAGWLGFTAFMTLHVIPSGGGGQETPYIAFVPVFILLCFAGLMMFFSPTRIPIIVQNRYRNVRGLKRVFYWIFQPGSRGFFRFLVGVLGLCALFACWMVNETTGRWPTAVHATTPTTALDVFHNWARGVSFVLQVPFFLAFPIGLALAFMPKLRENVAVQRTAVGIWWGLGGAVTAFYSVSAQMYHSDQKALLDLMAAVVSPVSSILISSDAQSVLYQYAGAGLRAALGLLGLYLMHGILRRRARDEDAARAGTAVAVSAVVPAAEPGVAA